MHRARFALTRVAEARVAHCRADPHRAAMIGLHAVRFASRNTAYHIEAQCRLV